MIRKPPLGKSLAELNPILSKEWHPTKNGSLSPYDVSEHNGKKVWWKCDEGDDHEWVSAVSSRSVGRGCPVCSGRKTVLSNCLATLNPDLASEWHKAKNDLLTPFDVGENSHKKVWWKCENGDDHEWQAFVYSRSMGNGCPVCDGDKVVLSNCLTTLNPTLAKEWHPTKNGSLTPYDVGEGSNKKVWWKCDKGDDHEWLSAVNSRSDGIGCSICAGQKIVLSNCLATLNPDLAKEWHPTKNGSLTPYDVSEGSNKKVWWKCDKGDDHVWITTVNSRSDGIGCPSCAEYGFNPNEPAILYYLKIKHDDKLYFKIGITNNDVKSRFDNKDFEKIIDYIELFFDKGKVALEIEQRILKQNKKHINFNQLILEDGNTEIFDKDVMNFGLLRKNQSKTKKGLNDYIDMILTEKAERKSK